MTQPSISLRGVAVVQTRFKMLGVGSELPGLKRQPMDTRAEVDDRRVGAGWWRRVHRLSKDHETAGDRWTLVAPAKLEDPTEGR